MFLPPAEEAETRHARHLYTLLIDIDRLSISRDEVLKELHRQRIGTGIHYRSLRLHEYYRKTFRYAGRLSSRRLDFRRAVAALVTEDNRPDVEDVIAAVSDVIANAAR